MGESNRKPPSEEVTVLSEEIKEPREIKGDEKPTDFEIRKGYLEKLLKVNGKTYLNIGYLASEKEQLLCDGKDHWSFGLRTKEIRKQYFGCDDKSHKEALK